MCFTSLIINWQFNLPRPRAAKRNSQARSPRIAYSVFKVQEVKNDLSLFTKEKFNHVCAEILFFHQLFQLFEDLSGFSADVGRMHAVFFGVDLRSKLHKKERYLIFLDSAHVLSILGRRLCSRRLLELPAPAVSRRQKAVLCRHLTSWCGRSRRPPFPRLNHSGPDPLPTGYRLSKSRTVRRQ